MEIESIIRRVKGFLICSLWFFCVTVYASPSQLARLEIGLNLLPSVIASNTRLGLAEDEEKEPLTIYVMYIENRKLAEQSMQRLTKLDNIRGYPLNIKAVSIDQLLNTEPDRYSTLINIEPLVNNREQLIQFCQRNQMLFFSPFKGDVEKGVMAGYEVTNKVLPAVNLSALKAANIHLKAFFLRIAVSHD